MTAILLDEIELDDQFEWTDEFTWSPVEQSQERSCSGALHVQEGVKLYGRPITLAANGGVWTPLSVLRQLEAMRDERGRVMQLTLADGRQHSVIWNHAETPLEARQVWREVAPTAGHPYELTLRLLTVAPPDTETTD